MEARGPHRGAAPPAGHLHRDVPGDTLNAVLAFYEHARVASDQAIAEVHLDSTAVTWLGDTVSFRWAILHMIEETARHAGHADVIRERIDNTTGYLPSKNLPY